MSGTAPAAKRRARKSKASVKKPKPKPTLVRTSERSSFKRCRWQWRRGFIDNLEAVQQKPALRFGSLIHKALELRYPPGIKRGPKPAETFERLFDEQLDEIEKTWSIRDSEGEIDDAKELGISMMEMFVEEYGRDEEWQVLGSEIAFQVPILGPDGKVLFYYVGTMDGVWKNRMDSGVRVQDWKTTSGDPVKEAQGKWVLDEQSTAYWTWGVEWLIDNKILKPKDQESLDGMLYTFLRKAKRDLRPQNADGHYLNKDGSVSKQQPAPYFHREVVYRSEHDREEARERAVQEFYEMRAARAGKIATYKTPATGSTGHCRWCEFADMCELHESGADWEGLRDVTMTTWDPYSAHEIAEEGKGK